MRHNLTVGFAKLVIQSATWYEAEAEAELPQNDAPEVLIHPTRGYNSFKSFKLN
jgi:hypothetical protein